MIFDPTNTRTREESIHHAWEHEWSEELKAIVRESADAQGCTWFELVDACLDQVMENMGHDPEQYESLMTRFRFASFPFGPDPLHVGMEGSQGHTDHDESGEAGA